MAAHTVLKSSSLKNLETQCMYTVNGYLQVNIQACRCVLIKNDKVRDVMFARVRGYTSGWRCLLAFECIYEPRGHHCAKAFTKPIF